MEEKEQKEEEEQAHTLTSRKGGEQSCGEAGRVKWPNRGSKVSNM